MATIGLIGAGHIGSQVARLAVAHGYHVVISNSRGPETVAALVAELGPNARAGTAVEAAKAGDIVVVTVPLKNYRQVPVEPLAGKVVIDTNNYYPQRDGHIPELDNESTTTSELLQAHLPASKVVKARTTEGPFSDPLPRSPVLRPWHSKHAGIRILGVNEAEIEAVPAPFVPLQKVLNNGTLRAHYLPLSLATGPSTPFGSCTSAS